MMASLNKNTRGGHTKKKRSFLYKARKYGKKGLYGRGKNVDEETYNYFVRVMERLKEEFEDEEEKEIFLTNVFEQTKDKEMDLICNQVISKVLEKLLPLAKPDVLEEYASIIQKSMRVICTDPYASHVLEKMMRIFLEKISSKTQEMTEEHRSFCFKWLCAVCQYAFNNVEDFIGDIYASHILRTSLQCLSGVEVDVMVSKSNRSRRHIDDEESGSSLPKFESAEFVTIVSEFGERFAAWPQLHDMVHSSDSSAVIQVVLLCIHKVAPEIAKKLMKVLVDDVLPTLSWNDIFTSSSVLHILEACLLISDEEAFAKLHQTYFKGHLKPLAINFDHKFVVLKLLDTVKDNELFTDIFEELAPAMEDIFAGGCGPVVCALANACRRLAMLQSKFVQQLMETFHCATPETRQKKIVPLVARLVTFDIVEQHDETQPPFPVHRVGSQIVQTLLQFGKPIKVVQSILEMDSSELRDLLCDQCGSHIVDAYVSAEFVGENSRVKLVHKLQGSYYALATNKHGSRALDALWGATGIKGRMLIGEELLQKETALAGNTFGRIVINNYALSLLKKQKTDWKAAQEKETKKRKLFAGIVEPLVASGDEDGALSVKRIKKEKKKKA